MVTTAPPSVFAQVLDYANRPNPYPLYAELRKTPVARQDDGSYIVSTYAEIVELLHDPRISSDMHNLPEAGASGDLPGLPPPFIKLDPPEHDRLRRIVTRHFGPPHAPDRVDSMVPDLRRIVTGLIDGLTGSTEVDIVDQFAYPFPVTVICELLGVPREDESRFHVWVEAIVQALDPGVGDPAEVQRKRVAAMQEMGQFFAGLVDAHRRAPGADLLSALATDDGPDGRLTDEQLLATSFLLLVAGHETTVNLIGNGTLALLRHPDRLAELRANPDLTPSAVEEFLRYDGPLNMATLRHTTEPVSIAGIEIPAGELVMVSLASANRDPDRYHRPDELDPHRDASHLAFGYGIHHCLGAPLARLEADVAFRTLLDRFPALSLAAEPTELTWRESTLIRGLARLPVRLLG